MKTTLLIISLICFFDLKSQNIFEIRIKAVYNYFNKEYLSKDSNHKRVIPNKIEICDFLLNYDFSEINKKDINALEQIYLTKTDRNKGWLHELLSDRVLLNKINYSDTIKGYKDYSRRIKGYKIFFLKDNNNDYIVCSLKDIFHVNGSERLFIFKFKDIEIASSEMYEINIH